MKDSEGNDKQAPEPKGGPTEVPVWKRVLDITIILLTLPVVLPVMLVIALVIRLVSAGPILFRQERIGHLGRPFLCYKFRTMVVGDNATAHRGHLDQLINSDAPMVKMDMKGDPRIIRFGLPLRASGLDELPQLINVLRGDMSLVGPRPCVRYEFDRHQAWQKQRYNTLPGLTGLWQVSGKNNTTFDEMILLDIRYGKTKSPWLDLKIMLLTVPALLMQMHETRQKAKARRAAAPAEPVLSANVVKPVARHQLSSR